LRLIGGGLLIAGVLVIVQAKRIEQKENAVAGPISLEPPPERREN
jgi:hypothetical protein